MSDLKKIFGRLLAAHRRQRGLTQAELADQAGLSVETITKLEGGHTGASFLAIEPLADALEIDPAELSTTGGQERRVSATTPNGTLCETRGA